MSFYNFSVYFGSRKIREGIQSLLLRPVQNEIYREEEPHSVPRVEISSLKDTETSLTGDLDNSSTSTRPENLRTFCFSCSREHKGGRLFMSTHTHTFKETPFQKNKNKNKFCEFWTFIPNRLKGWLKFLDLPMIQNQSTGLERQINRVVGRSKTIWWLKYPNHFILLLRETTRICFPYSLSYVRVKTQQPPHICLLK